MTGPFLSSPRFRILLVHRMRHWTSALIVLAGLTVPFPGLGLYHAVAAPGRSELAPGHGQERRARVTQESPSPSPSPTATLEVRPRGLLRQAKHAERLDRVQVNVRGMTNKLQNLSSRLNKHKENVERRIVALQAAGHDITVEEELAAARTAVQALQEKIATTIRELDALADSDRPRTVVPAVRRLTRDIHADLRTVRAAFQKLRLAIRADVRARPSPTTGTPSPSPTALPSPSPTTRIP